MKRVIVRQYRDIVNSAKAQICNIIMPSEGWIRTVRKSLGMSGSQLAKRMGVTRAQISNSEKSEVSGGVTLKSMKKMAEAMNCRFVYAVIPEKNIESIIQNRAIEKARDQVKEASIHMALEGQALGKNRLNEEVERLAKEMIEKLDSDFWNDNE